MKIGILTYHSSINYGSFLQAYSLQKELSKIEGVDSEIINYNTSSSEILIYKTLLAKSPSEIISRIKKLLTFKKEIKNNLVLSKSKLVTNNIKKATSYINRQNYDYVVVGSDEVWKITKLRGFPNIYFLGDENLIPKRISYAASTNKSEVLFKDLELEKKDYIVKCLKKYEYIGVRDKLTYNQLEMLSDELVLNYNSDPTFFYDFSHEEKTKLRSKLQTKYGVSFDKPIIGLMTTNKTISKVIHEKFSKTHQILAIHQKNDFAHKYIDNLTPFEFAHIFSFFTLSITSFFHGTIFSIKNNIPFISVEDSPLYLNYKSKVLDLLEKANLKSNYLFLNKNDSSASNEHIYKLISTKISEKVNYDKFLLEQRELSIPFFNYIKSLIK